MLHLVTLGVALGEVDHKVREVGGNNRGPRIKEYLANLDPPIVEGAPWCAAFVHYCADVAARALGVPNPLDAVKHEALVQSYFNQFSGSKKDGLSAGHLVLYRFGDGATSWNHIGLVARPVTADKFWAVEGNTGDGSERDGDGVFLKLRDRSKYPTVILSWP